MKIYQGFQNRPSGASVFSGSCFIKTGPDCTREAELLKLASDFTPKLYASSSEIIILQEIKTQIPILDRLEQHFDRLVKLHKSNIKNPNWRLCSINDYVAYCLRPKSDSVPSLLYDLITKLSPNIERIPPVFIHGDATISNSIGNYFIDLSVRPTTGDPIQDWSKFLFSILGFDLDLFNSHGLLPSSVLLWYLDHKEIHPHFSIISKDKILIRTPEMAFHFACNLIRVSRKEKLDTEFLNRSLSLLSKYL